MPYNSNSALPPAVRNALPDAAQSIFRNVVNSRLAAGQSDQRAFRQGWAVVHRSYKKPANGGKWQPKETSKLEVPSYQGVNATPEKPTLKRYAPVYVCRYLVNAEDFVKWAKAQGFKTTIVPEDLHVTIAYSRQPIDWPPQSNDRLVIRPSSARTLERLGDKGAVVLRFDSEILTKRWNELRRHGASWDHGNEYKPHVTISYRVPEGFNLDKVKPYDGELIFGPEYSRALDSDPEHVEKLREVAKRTKSATTFGKALVQYHKFGLTKGYPEYDPDQPRSKGGKWTGGGAGPAGRLKGRAGLFLGMAAALRAFRREGQRISMHNAGRALAEDAAERVARTTGQNLKYPSKVMQRDAIRHLRMAANRSEGKRPFREGIQAAEEVAQQVARRQVIRGQGGKLTPIPVPRRTSGQLRVPNIPKKRASQSFGEVLAYYSKRPQYRIALMKADDKGLGLIFGWAIISSENGEPYYDTQGDHIPEDSMLRAASEFMQSKRTMKIMHAGKKVGTVVFAWPMTQEIAEAMGIKGGRTGLMIAVKPDNPNVLDRFRNNQYTGFSIGGNRLIDEEEEDEEEDSKKAINFRALKGLTALSFAGAAGLGVRGARPRLVKTSP